MHQQHLARVGTWLIAFFQDLQRARKQVVAHLTIGNRAFADFHQFIRLIEYLVRRIRFEREELRHADGNPVENALQCADRGIGLIGLDQRYGGVGHAGPFGKLALRQILPHAHITQPPADIDAHRSFPPHVYDVRYSTNLIFLAHKNNNLIC